MRTLLVTVLVMGGSVLAVGFAFVNMASLGRQQPAAHRKRADERWAETYAREVLPVIRPEPRSRGTAAAPTGRIAALTALFRTAPEDAAEGLARLGHPGAVEALGQLLAAEADASLRKLLMEAMRRSGIPEGRRELERIATGAADASDREIARRLLSKDG